LRAYCKDNDIEIVAEFADTYSGGTLDRPGLDTLRDVVSAGGIDLVLAQDRDRIAREPAYHYLLKREFEEHGTKIRALNDRGDDSPEGELTDGILDQLAKFERAKTVERTRRGKIRKAQEGKVVGNGRAPYGFRYADNHYHIDPERMPYVREMFEMSAAGHSLYAISQHLTRVGAPTVGGGKWYASTIRKIILSDTYTGTFWWGKKRVITTNASVMKNGKKTYRKKTRVEHRDPSEWIAIPVPDSGIPPETVARARETVKDNVRAASKNDGKTWELSGGIAVCAECGGRMVAYTTRNSVGKAYHYYRCHHRHVRHRPAEGLEKEVVDAVVSAFHPDAWESFVEDLCNRRLDDLHRLGRSDPVKTRERLAGRIGALQTKISRARDLFIDGDLPRPDYDEKKSLLQDEIELVQEELTKVDDLDDEIGRVEALRRTLLSIENPLSGHYAVTDGADPDAMMDNNLSYGSRETAAKRRQEFYRRTGMRVRVGEELEISLGIGEPLVGKLDIASA
jgi:site-specific DNA recombinase